MTDQKLTCDPARIHAFLESRLSKFEADEFENHLDACNECRKQLTETTADDLWWTDARELLSRGDSESRELKETLSFLNPSDNPRMMGRFGGYEIAGLIGQGGMGIVLKGFDESLNRYAAIKVLAPQLATRGSARNRFAREAQAAAAVVHDNVIAIHGVSEAAGLPFLVMPYVRGESLQKRIDREGPMSPTEIVRVAHQIASGLSAAHKQGLVHRDIKPANILLPEGIQRVLITDFGLARAVDDSNLTGTGTIAGTPQFMSPEQARGDSVDTRSDLFSLGTVMYSMCTGRTPFRASNPFGALRRIIEDQPRDIREINTEVPGWLQTIVNRLHEKSPSDRFQSADELSELLENCLAHLQNPVIELPEQLKKLSHRPRRKPVWLGTVAVSIAAILGCLLLVASYSGLGWDNFWKQDKDNPELNSKLSSDSSRIETLTAVDIGDSNQNTDGQEAENRLNQDKEQTVADDGTNPLPQAYRQIEGTWVLTNAVRDGVGQTLDFEYRSKELQEMLGGLKEVFFDERHVYLVRNMGGESEAKLGVQWLDLVFDAKSEPMQMVWTEAHGNRQITSTIEVDLQNSMPTRMQLTIGNEVRCTFERSEHDLQLIGQRLKGDGERAQKSNENGDRQTASYLGELASSYQREINHAVQIEAIYREVAVQGKGALAELSPKQFQLMEARIQAMDVERDRRVELKEKQELIELSKHLAKLQEEGSFIESLAVERELWERMKRRDKDIARLNDLRLVMISNRIDGAHSAADKNIRQMQEIEQALLKRYRKLDRIRFFQAKIREQVEPGLKQVDELLESGDEAQAKSLRANLDETVRQLQSEFVTPVELAVEFSNFEKRQSEIDRQIAHQEAVNRLSKAKANFAHSKSLFEKGFVTKQQMENDQAEVRIAKLGLEKVRNSEGGFKQNEIIDRRIAYESALSEFGRSKNVYVHSMQLFEKGFVTKQQLEADQGDFDIAKMKLKKAQNELRMLVPDEFEDQEDSDGEDLSVPPVYGIELFQSRDEEETMRRLRTTIEAFGKQLEAAKSGRSKKNPQVVKLSAQIDHWKELLRELEAEQEADAKDKQTP